MALIVANTTNVKEMKNGRPMNIQVPGANLPNCTIVKIGAAGKGELDHVYSATVIKGKPAAEDLAAGLIYVLVAPEIMLEEARRTDGHIGKFVFKQGDVVTGYKLTKHDRLELSANHPHVEAGTEVGRRKMAEAMYLLAEEDKAAAIDMVKIEF